jgi:hypothetical protein
MTTLPPIGARPPGGGIAQILQVAILQNLANGLLSNRGPYTRKQLKRARNILLHAARDWALEMRGAAKRGDPT